MSNATGPQSLSRLLMDVPTLRELTRSSGKQARASQAVALTLPPALAAHSRVELLDDQVLLLARNNSVAQMLRFHGPRLAREAGVRGYRVRIMADLFASTAAPTAAEGPVLPPAAEPVLDELAGAVGDDALAEALRRLADLGRQP